MNNVKVTIITRTIPKREHFLERNIKCVLSQTFSNYEHIIIVDDENIKVDQILVNKNKEKYKGRCKVIRSNPPYGNMEAASNIALNQAKGDYISFLDDDDTWEPTFLEEVMCFFETNNFSSVRGVVTESTIVNETVINGAIREDSRVDFKKYPNGVLLFDILGSNQFTNNSFVYDRETLKVVGLYDEKLPVQGDWDFNIRFLRHYDIGVIPKPLANYHLRYSPDTIQGNTVTADVDKHLLVGSMIRNKYIREAMDTSNDLEVYIKSFASGIAPIAQELALQKAEIKVINEKVSSVEQLVRYIRNNPIYRLLRKVKNKMK